MNYLYVFVHYDILQEHLYEHHRNCVRKDARKGVRKHSACDHATTMARFNAPL